MRTKSKSSATKPVAKNTSKAAPAALSAKDVAKVFDACIGRNAKFKPLAEELRRIVKKTLPAASETINPWGIPEFDLQGPVCLMMIWKNHITLIFPRGTSLDDPARLLEGTGKNLRHVKLSDAAQLRNSNLRALILESAALNRATPLTSSMRAK
jgi:hypothetical protein